MRERKCLRDLDQFAMRIIGAKINRSADGGCAHIIGLFDRAKQNLLKVVWISQQFIMIDLHQEWNFMCILASHNP